MQFTVLCSFRSHAVSHVTHSFCTAVVCCSSICFNSFWKLHRCFDKALMSPHLFEVSYQFLRSEEIINWHIIQFTTFYVYAHPYSYVSLRCVIQRSNCDKKSQDAWQDMHVCCGHQYLPYRSTVLISGVNE